MNTEYSKWLSDIRSVIQEESTPSFPDEMELQSKWFQGAFGLEFLTTRKQRVTIDYLGEWNHGSGPDFLECLFSIDGKPVKGAIELDKRSQDWEIHGHATNSEFDKVALHISFTDTSTESFCRTSQNSEVPQIIISPDQIRQALEFPSKSPEETIEGFCANEFSTWTQEEINSLLKAASHHRLSSKAAKLASQVQAIGLRETLWQALATTLGYGPNKVALHLLSQRIKSSKMHQVRTSERVGTMLGTAGFLTTDFYQKAPTETQSYLKEIWDEWWKLRGSYELHESRAISWQSHGQRPINHPHRRIAALALLYPRLSNIVKVVQVPNASSFEELKEDLTSVSDEFWSRHYTLTSQASSKHLSLFGADKWKELLSNFLIPLWYLHDQDAAFGYYSAQKAPAQNIKVKRALSRLFPHHNTKAQLTRFNFQHQGLQQLYSDFCLYSGCLNCPFPKLSHYDTALKYD